MPDEQLPTSPKPPVSTGVVVGRDKPFTREDVNKEGVDPDTGLFHGIHPDTKERLAVTLEGLKAEFGDKLGEKKYIAIAGIGGGTVFFNPNSEATSFRPSLGIGGLSLTMEELADQYGAEQAKAKFEVNQKYAAQVAEILAAKE